MNLSLYTGGVKPYLEYGWVCAPNTARQSIAANTITTLTIDTEVADTGGFGSIASNQITLAAGTYYFNATTRCHNDNIFSYTILGLYNNTSSSYVTRRGPKSTSSPVSSSGGAYSQNIEDMEIAGQFTITTPSTFSLYLSTATGGGIYNTSGAASSIATAGADQRTTIKLWKLA